MIIGFLLTHSRSSGEVSAAAAALSPGWVLGMALDFAVLSSSCVVLCCAVLCCAVLSASHALCSLGRPKSRACVGSLAHSLTQSLTHTHTPSQPATATAAAAAAPLPSPRRARALFQSLRLPRLASFNQLTGHPLNCQWPACLPACAFPARLRPPANHSWLPLPLPSGAQPTWHMPNKSNVISAPLSWT